MKDLMSEDDELTRQTYIEASPERVFDFLTSQEKIEMWWGSNPSIDARPGGIYRVEFMGGKAVARGEFVEVVPYQRVVHTWGWEGEGAPMGPGESLVEITLAPSGNGTLVTLRHSGLRGSAEFHSLGWDHYLPRLTTISEGGDPGPDMLDTLDVSFPTPKR